MADTINDQEFGAITIRRSRLARNVRLKVSQNGLVSISMPKYAPLYLAQRLLEQAREQVRTNLTQTNQELTLLNDGDLIGKSHRLQISEGSELASRLADMTLQVTLPSGMPVHSPKAQMYIKKAALKALKKQAQAYLTRRLAMLAHEFGFSYKNIRFSNAGTRWGSCSTTGTISMNIWLMQLPFELIDYVLIHELCHTREMNHSPKFWWHVQMILPNYKLLKKQLKDWHPYL